MGATGASRSSNSANGGTPGVGATGNPVDYELVSIIELIKWATRPSVLLRMTRKSIAWRERKIHQRAAKYGVPATFAVWWSKRMADQGIVWKLFRRSIWLQSKTMIEVLDQWARREKTNRPKRHSPEALTRASDNALGEPVPVPPGDREQILVVVHETSRTGAPILAWNIVERLAKQYDVVTIRLGDGPLTPEFEAISSEVVTWNPNRLSKPHAVFKRRKFKYAIINSCESRDLIDFCNNYSIPTVFLMHEFASYVYAIDSLCTAFDNATEIVFSAPVIEQDAKKAHPALLQRAVHILPQGRCTVPSSYSRQPVIPEVLDELSRVKKAKNLFVVLGAGSVEFRKGVDLFLETASTVQRELYSRDVQFVWIGKGYNPERDKQYSVYLKEQMLRSNFRLQPLFLGELGDLDPIYAIADVLLLSSRLDPLPNVSIDAACLGLPIVCFENASGMADILRQDAITSTAVVNYSDTAAAAGVIKALASDEFERQRMSHAVRCLAERTFDMENYVACLDEIGKSATQPNNKQNEAITPSLLQA